jgi:hypothetical protein
MFGPPIVVKIPTVAARGRNVLELPLASLVDEIRLVGVSVP